MQNQSFQTQEKLIEFLLETFFLCLSFQDFNHKDLTKLFITAVFKVHYNLKLGDKKTISYDEMKKIFRGIALAQNKI